MESLYIETSIVSYLRQKPSSQVVTAARQLMTHQWWNSERTKYQLAVSQFVIDEASAGDPALADERLESLEGIPLLPLVDEIASISDEIMARAILPDKARIDSLHIATVAHHRIQLLVDMELSPHRQCPHIATHPCGTQRSRYPNTDYLHT